MKTNKEAVIHNDNRQFKYLSLLTSLYVAFQLISDATAGKLISLFGHTVSVTVIYFPVTFIFADVLTEVYGYSRARRTLWTVMLCSIIAGCLYGVVAVLPPAPEFDANAAYQRVFGVVPRVLFGGWVAVFAGEITNNFIMARLKVNFDGKYLWLRTISSTIVGQLVNTGVFYIIGLYGILPSNILLEAIIAGWILKVIVEVIATPVTYRIVSWLKRAESVDHYDRTTNFNPFAIRED
jgi:queuosine precursor transporter